MTGPVKNFNHSNNKKWIPDIHYNNIITQLLTFTIKYHHKQSFHSYFNKFTHSCTYNTMLLIHTFPFIHSYSYILSFVFYIFQTTKFFIFPYLTMCSSCPHLWPFRFNPPITLHQIVVRLCANSITVCINTIFR